MRCQCHFTPCILQECVTILARAYADSPLPMVLLSLSYSICRIFLKRNAFCEIFFQYFFVFSRTCVNLTHIRRFQAACLIGAPFQLKPLKRNPQILTITICRKNKKPDVFFAKKFSYFFAALPDNMPYIAAVTCRLPSRIRN